MTPSAVLVQARDPCTPRVVSGIVVRAGDDHRPLGALLGRERAECLVFRLEVLDVVVRDQPGVRHPVEESPAVGPTGYWASAR